MAGQPSAKSNLKNTGEMIGTFCALHLNDRQHGTFKAEHAAARPVLGQISGWPTSM
jgi:hypothetical protein